MIAYRSAALETTASAPRASTRRWAWSGGLLGLLLALVCFAPASWLAGSVASATHGHVLLTETRGSLWNGSSVLVLTGGSDSRDAAALPGRLSWTLRPELHAGLALLLTARLDGTINDSLRLRVSPGIRRVGVEVLDQSGWAARLPASLLTGLGTPWNTLQLEGTLRLATQGLRLDWADGRWQQTGRLELDLADLSSRVSTVAPLGSYHFSLSGDTGQPGVSAMRLYTVDGALLVTGQGTLGNTGAHFSGEARAAPGREAALDNLLNIIGHREGARSVITIG